MVNKMKTVFFCGHKSAYGLAHLVPLLQSNFNIIGVVLATDKRWNVFREKLSGKSHCSYNSYWQRIKMIVKKLIPQSVLSKLKKGYGKSIDTEIILKEYKVPFWYVDNVNSEEFIQKIKKIQPDLIISAAYPQIFSKKLISIPTQGAVNCHPSLLPKFRGAHPHFWAIAKGETESGLTAHFMTEHIDDGDIIEQISFPISGYTYRNLYKKIIEETPNLIKQVQEFFLESKQKMKKQDDSKATYFRNDREIHHRIFWSLQDDKEIYNLARTGTAFCFFRMKKITITKCYISETNRNLTNNIKVEEGIIVDISKDSVVIKAKNGCINIREVICDRKKMSSLNFAKKFKIEIGERFD